MAYFEFEGKKVFYSVKGEGLPVLLLHGNSVSSRLFVTVRKEYSKNFKLIMFDFPGHGKSDRVEKFETDFWFYNAQVASAIIRHLNLEKVCVIGTSGGAQVAINLALEHPDVVKCLIADSFEGADPDEAWIKGLPEERAQDKAKFFAKLFWLYNHGWDWSKVVDQDTEMLGEFLKLGRSFFHKDISELRVPTLFTGSLQDEFIDNIDKRYKEMTDKNPSIKTKLFNEGKHPAMISNKKDFFPIAKDFMEYIGG